MGLGVFDLVGLLGSLIFAIPVANFGITRLLAGETAMGLALLAVAVAMVAVPHYLLDPKQLAGRLLAGLLPARLRGASADSDTPADSDTRTDDE